jgi:hypothetical protein
MKPVYFILISLIVFSNVSFAQVDSTAVAYEQTYLVFDSSLSGLRPLPFKEAVYEVENTYLGGIIAYDRFSNYVGQLATLAKDWENVNHLRDYPYPDSTAMKENSAIYKLMKDTIKILTTDTSGYLHLPYTYDFDDFDGNDAWTDMFVTKLIASHSGNCHSLPYLYKMIADEMGAPCWLALAPNHMYIKNRCKGLGWYNTELTSGCFPIDAWIMASGYLPIQAVKSGIYMDTLSSNGALTLCVIDLAKGYERKTHNYYDGFILKCCDLALKYNPVNVQAVLLKAETLKRIYEREKDEKHLDDKALFQKMEQLYGQLYDLGYREMPENMYRDWLQSVMKEKGRFANKQIPETVQGNKSL